MILATIKALILFTIVLSIIICFSCCVVAGRCSDEERNGEEQNGYEYLSCVRKANKKKN